MFVCNFLFIRYFIRHFIRYFWVSIVAFLRQYNLVDGGDTMLWVSYLGQYVHFLH